MQMGGQPGRIDRASDIGPHVMQTELSPWQL